MAIHQFVIPERRFRQSANVRVCDSATDLDAATKFAEEDPPRNQLVIVDVTGRNAGKSASLRRLTRFKIPTLLIASERIANELELAEGSDGAAIWEWTADDFSALLWPENKSDGERGELVRFEQKLKSSAAIEPEVTTVQLPLAGEAHTR